MENEPATRVAPLPSSFQHGLPEEDHLPTRNFNNVFLILHLAATGRDRQEEGNDKRMDGYVFPQIASACFPQIVFLLFVRTDDGFPVGWATVMLVDRAVAEFIEELLHGRFVPEQFSPAMFTAYRWQLNIADMSYDDMYDVFGEVTCKGLSGDSLKKLPWHVISDDDNEDGSCENMCCAICLQDLQLGEIARSLPSCRHTFHLSCVDKWLIRHGSCPVCRQDV